MKVKNLQFSLCLLFILGLNEAFAQFQRKNPTFEKSDSVITTPTNPTSSSPTSQQPPSQSNKTKFIDKLAIGGNFSLSFGNVTFINISPLVGYKLTEKLMPGIGLTYMYYNTRGFSQHFYGGNIFTRYTVFNNFFVHAELEALRVSTSYNGQDSGINRWSISPLIGGGYTIRIGKFGGIMMTLLYNLNYNQATSIYSSPIIYRIGFIF